MENMTKKPLTKAEEQIMQILWQIEKGFVNDIISKMSIPKPSYNTVSTIVRILETKKFVAHRSLGRSHQYYPIVSKDAYKKYATEKLMQSYFNNSFESMLSFFVNEKEISVNELDDILKIIKNEKK